MAHDSPLSASTVADGVGIDTIAQQWGAPIQCRTLQRRLALLVAQQRIEMLGDRRTARYRRRASAAISAKEPEATWRVAPPPDDLPESTAGAEVRAYVTQPRQQRRPVAYRQSFLEQYQPNQTAYLALDLREQLHAKPHRGGCRATAYHPGTRTAAVGRVRRRANGRGCRR